MSLETIGIDAAIGTGSFLLSTVGTMISKLFVKLEADRVRSHEKEILLLNLAHKREQREWEDLKKVRELSKNDFELSKGSFIGITRRFIALTVPFLFIMLALLAFLSIPINIETHAVSHFLWWKSTTTKIDTVTGFLILPWFQQWCFMVGGFYFGRLVTK